MYMPSSNRVLLATGDWFGLEAEDPKRIHIRRTSSAADRVLDDPAKVHVLTLTGTKHGLSGAARLSLRPTDRGSRQVGPKCFAHIDDCRT